MKEKKSQTHYKTFHKGFTKRKGRRMTEGDIREILGSIKVQIHKWPDDVLISVRNLKGILGRCGFYLTEGQIRKLSQEGQLEGKKFYSVWYYPKDVLYRWVSYLENIGLWLLITRGIIKEKNINEQDASLLLISKKNSMKRFKKERTNV